MRWSHQEAASFWMWGCLWTRPTTTTRGFFLTCRASATPTETLLGAVISHPHQDHFGLAKHVGSGVQVYIGEAAHNILTAASRYVPGGQAFSNPRFLSQKKPVEIGPVKVTPYLLDHSAFDAYSLLVEADDKRVF